MVVVALWLVFCIFLRHNGYVVTKVWEVFQGDRNPRVYCFVLFPWMLKKKELCPFDSLPLIYTLYIY